MASLFYSQSDNPATQYNNLEDDDLLEFLAGEGDATQPAQPTPPPQTVPPPIAPPTVQRSSQPPPQNPVPVSIPALSATVQKLKVENETLRSILERRAAGVGGVGRGGVGDASVLPAFAAADQTDLRLQLDAALRARDEAEQAAAKAKADAAAARRDAAQATRTAKAIAARPLPPSPAPTSLRSSQPASQPSTFATSSTFSLPRPPLPSSWATVESVVADDLAFLTCDWAPGSPAVGTDVAPPSVVLPISRTGEADLQAAIRRIVTEIRRSLSPPHSLLPVLGSLVKRATPAVGARALRVAAALVAADPPSLSLSLSTTLGDLTKEVTARGSVSTGRGTGVAVAVGGAATQADACASDPFGDLSSSTSSSATASSSSATHRSRADARTVVGLSTSLLPDACACYAVVGSPPAVRVDLAANPRLLVADAGTNADQLAVLQAGPEGRLVHCGAGCAPFISRARAHLMRHPVDSSHLLAHCVAGVGDFSASTSHLLEPSFRFMLAVAERVNDPQQLRSAFQYFPFAEAAKLIPLPRHSQASVDIAAVAMRLLTVLCADRVLGRSLLLTPYNSLQTSLVDRVVTWTRVDKGEASLVRPTAIQLLLTIEFFIRSVGDGGAPLSPNARSPRARKSKRARTSVIASTSITESTHVATVSPSIARYLLLALFSALQALGAAPTPSRTAQEPAIAFASVAVVDGLVQLLALAGPALIDVFEGQEKLASVTPNGIVPALATYRRHAANDGNEVAAAAADRLASVLSAKTQ